MWLLLSASAGLSSSVFNFINRKVLKTNGDSTSYGWWFEFFRTFIFAIFATLTFSNFRNFDYSHIYILFSLGLVEFVTIYIYMRMHALTDLSISSVVIQLRTVWVPIFAVIILGEFLSIYEYIGILFVFLGQTIVFSPKRFREDKGVVFAFMASIATGLGTVVMKKSLEYYSIPVSVVAFGLPSIIGYPMLMKGGINRIIRTGKSVGNKIFIAVIFNSLAMFLLTTALKIQHVGKVAGIYQSFTIASVIVGIVLLGERKNAFRKVVGAVVVVGGALLLI